MVAPRQPLRRGVCAALAALASLGVAGCGDGGGPDAPATGGDAAPADGAALYARHCASCHGTDLRGTAAGPSHLSEVYEPSHHSDEAFRLAIARGSPAHHWDFGDMPPVPGLDDAEVEAIIGYVRAVQEREGFERYPPG